MRTVGKCAVIERLAENHAQESWLIHPLRTDSMDQSQPLRWQGNLLDLFRRLLSRAAAGISSRSLRHVANLVGCQSMFRRLFRSLVLYPQVDDDDDEIARFLIPANDLILGQTNMVSPTYHRSRMFRRYAGRQAVQRQIDGHPDLHDYLWERAGASLPRECCWVIRAIATFANPETNVIFAAAEGTHRLRIRLSDKSVASCIKTGTGACVDDLGFRWVETGLKIDDDRAMLAMAYEDSQSTMSKPD